MTRGIFVAGTDTGVGKTVAAVALLRGLVAAGVRAVGMKPIAAGVDAPAEVNADVAALAAAGNVAAPLRERNPYALAAAVAPHLAARAEGIALRLDVIADAYRRLAGRADVVVVEGAGGVCVPLDAQVDLLDVPRGLRLPVVLVVGVRLGGLNHALLSTLAVEARGLRLAGWIASRIDPGMPLANENVEWLARRLPMPLVADLASAEPAPVPPSALAALGLVERRS